MKLVQQLREALAGHAVAPPRPSSYRPVLPESDDPEQEVPIAGHPAPVAGYSCIIEYKDSRGRFSARQVSCVRIEQTGPGKTYLRAYCHERRSQRTFLIGSISTVMDAITGEVLDDGPRFFARFSADRVHAGQLNWGLPPRRRAELAHGLTALTFLGRCDDDWHPAEREVVEQFATGWWLRSEIAGDMPVDDLMAHCDRLAPDSEAFVVALDECCRHPLIARMLLPYAEKLIVADGKLHANEQRWIRVVATILEDAID